MLPNKSRDEKQRSEAAPRKSNEEEFKIFELLPGLDWVITHTHTHTGVEPKPKRKPSTRILPAGNTKAA